jgi:hypothetical protein
VQPDPCWCLLEQLMPQLMRLAPRTRVEDRVLYYDELITRWPRLLETWKPELSPLQPYVVMSIKLYFSKIRAASEAQQACENCDSHRQLAAREINLDSLSGVLDSGLTPFDAQLLRLYFVERHTHAELALWLSHSGNQTSESQARLLVLRARSRACTLLVLRPAINQIEQVLKSWLKNEI